MWWTRISRGCTNAIAIRQCSSQLLFTRGTLTFLSWKKETKTVRSIFNIEIVIFTSSNLWKIVFVEKILCEHLFYFRRWPNHSMFLNTNNRQKREIFSFSTLSVEWVHWSMSLVKMPIESSERIDVLLLQLLMMTKMKIRSKNVTYDASWCQVTLSCIDKSEKIVIDDERVKNKQTQKRKRRRKRKRKRKEWMNV